MSLLPPQMNSVEAKAQLIAIGLQESRFLHRKQIGGPARGFWQFEQGGGIKGVLHHHATRDHIREVLAALKYQPTAKCCYEAVAHNDILALAFARLNLWWVPGALPEEHHCDLGWDYYIEAWRPGKPHRKTWNAFFDQAWSCV